MSTSITLDANEKFSAGRYSPAMETRIRLLRIAKNLTQAQMAEALGMHITNYNRMEMGHTDLSMSRLEKISKILGCEPLDLLTERPQVRVLQVTGAVEAGAWRETVEWDRSDWYDIAIPERSAPAHLTLYAAEVRGRSMARRYPPGSVVVFTDIVETREAPVYGRPYIVDRIDGDVRERTLKILKRGADGQAWLSPDTDDPGFEEFPVLGSSTTEIRLVGPVIWSMVPQPPDPED